MNRLVATTFTTLTVLPLLLASGCATVFRGSTEEVVINTIPEGATVTLSTGHTCTTPCTIDVKRKGDIKVDITKNGYEPVSTLLTSGISGASLGVATTANLLFLPGINDYVDYKSGANYIHRPNPLEVRLVESRTDCSAPCESPDAAGTEAAPVASESATTP